MSKVTLSPVERIRLTGELATEIKALEGASPLDKVQIAGRVAALLERLGINAPPHAGKSLAEYLAESEGDGYKAAMAYYKGELQGEVVQTPVGPVRLSSKGLRKYRMNLNRDAIKAQLVPHLVEILVQGSYGPREPLYKPREDGVVAFYFAQKDIELEGQIITAGVTVAEDGQGNLFYNLTHSGQPAWQRRNENGTLDSTLSIIQSFALDAAENSVAEDDLNITILAVRPVAQREPFAAAEDAKGGTVLLKGDAEVIAARVRELGGKPQIVEGGVRLTKGDARLAAFVPVAIERLASGAQLEHYASGGIGVRGNFEGTTLGIASSLARLESAFVLRHGPEVFAQVFGRPAAAEDVVAYEEDQAEIGQRKAENEARDTAVRIDYAKRTGDWTKLSDAERDDLRAERDAILTANAERDLAQWQATIGSGTSGNQRLQAYLDTLEDLAPENRTMIQIGYMAWIPQRMTEYEREAGRMPFVSQSAEAVAWHEGFTAHCRAWADQHLSERVQVMRAAGGAAVDVESSRLYQAPELYHGTALPFDAFSTGERRGAGFDHQGAGVYLTTDRQGFARFFAGIAAAKIAGKAGNTPEQEELLEDGVILRVSIAGARVLDLTQPDASPELRAMVSDIVNGSALRERVLSMGFDGVAFIEPNTPEGVTFEPGAVTVVMYHPDKAKVLGYEPAATVTPLALPEEPAAKPAAAQHEIVEHHTKGGKGKIIRGIILRGVTHAQAHAIDEYTFPKDGGYFIRERHLATMGTLPVVEPEPAADPEVQAQRRAQQEADRIANEQARQQAKVAKQVATLRSTAASALAKAEEELGASRTTNTARRANMAASILARAEKDRALAVSLNNLADAIEQGKATHLGGITSKAQLATLHQALVGGRHRSEQDLSYSERERNKSRAFDGKDVGYAELPKLSMRYDYAPVLAALREGKPKGWASIVKQLQAQNQLDVDPLVFAAAYKALESIGKESAFNWYAKEQAAKRSRLIRMGLNTDSDLRAALTEYLAYREGVREEDPVAKAERAIIGQKVGIDFFPTPKAEGVRMAGLAGIKPGDLVLEPSAGNGNLADAARAAGAQVDVVEISSQLRDILTAKGYTVVAHDFMELDLAPKYDAILMNPPFSNRRDAEHIQRAFQMLKPGGRLVAIAGEGVFIGSDAKAVQFRAWLDEHGAEVEALGAGTFKAKDLLAQTGANARLIVVQR
ncbi:LPD3 domain-containing protein [Pseudomonas oryzihabitans]|uniref:LPD3 domain-containing protein n=1 Tax=Pseudomonas oryzihabitans TaxID=47885 RepID=UPI0028B1E3C0|nr:hypothetical protein [Pseudomonas oryzihabitans]